MSTNALTEPTTPQPILFLTNNDNVSPLYEWLLTREPLVMKTGDAITSEMASTLVPSFVLSFNYRHIIPADTIAAFGCPVVNVHCSMLPWNRGASPNFFSFYTNTPKGVTVHELTAGLDKGGILLQKEVGFCDVDETFESSYQKLLDTAFELIESNCESLKFGKLVARAQDKGGSYHRSSELVGLRKRYPFSWSDNIGQWKAKYGLD